MSERMEVWCKRLHKAYSYIPLAHIEAIISAVLYDYKIGELTQAEVKILLYDMFVERLRAERMEG
nr:MAG TPA: hypothetical protein [Caudoviricetes sp.]